MSGYLVRHIETGVCAAPESLDGYGADAWEVLGAIPPELEGRPVKEEGGAIVADLSPLRESRKQALAQYRDAVVLATVETAFGTFYTDDKSKLLMAGKLLGLLLVEKLGQPVPETVTFKTVSGFQTFATADFMVAALQVLGGIEAAFGTQETLEAAIDTLSDPAAIAAVEWPEVPE